MNTDIKTMADADLVTRIVAGDQDAIMELARRAAKKQGKRLSLANPGEGRDPAADAEAFFDKHGADFGMDFSGVEDLLKTIGGKLKPHGIGGNPDALGERIILVVRGANANDGTGPTVEKVRLVQTHNLSPKWMANAKKATATAAKVKATASEVVEALKTLKAEETNAKKKGKAE